MKKSGGKFTRSHTTIIEAAEPLVDFAHKNRLVTKISLGIIKPIKSSTDKRIKLVVEQACLLAHIRGKRAIQEIRFFTTDTLIFEKELRTFAHTQGFNIS